MADVAADIKDWSTTASSNSPADATTVGAGLADNFQQIQATVRAAFAHKGSDIASATTADLGAVTGYYHDITGTTTITGFGTVSAGVRKVLQFDGSLTLTYNATSMILPGNVDITTAAGDHLEAMSLGSGNWVVLWYSKDAAGSAPPFSDAVGIVRGSSDATKILRLEVDGFTTATTRVITPPDADLTIPAVTAKGDLVAASASGVLARVAVSATDGDVLIADSAASPGVSYRTKLTIGTATATTSGTSVDVTGIPAWAKRVTVLFDAVSSDGTSSYLVQLGDGALETSGYVSESAITTGAGTTVTSSTAGFIMNQNSASGAMSGSLVLNLSGTANTWIGVGISRFLTTSASYGGGTKTLTGTLDRIRLTTVNGTDAFDAGAITVVYE